MKKTLLTTSLGLACFVAFGASANDAAPASQLKNRSIAYVLTNEEYAVYSTPDKKECPQGMNDGPREEYDALYPKDDKVRTVAETELAREAAIWFPDVNPNKFPYKFATSKTAPGLNLDGKVGPNDFTSPDGEAGIDNQYYRVIGCTIGLRAGAYYYYLTNNFAQRFNYARQVIELTNVDSLVNDDDVTVTRYRALDKMMTDASGNEYLPYGSQRVDPRWGKEFYARTHAKIVNGVLITEPFDVNWPHSSSFSNFALFQIKGSVLKVKVTPEEASGLWGGYLDVDSWYRQMNSSSSTHTLTASSIASQSMYQAAHQLADAYPDPKTGKNTAISSARIVKFKQVYLTHADERVAEENAPATPKQAAQNLSR